MKLVSYNIQYGFGSDGRYDLERAARVVEDADIIALQEVERFWQRSNEDDQPEILGRLLPNHYWIYGPAFDMDASLRSGGRIVNRRRQFGTMILSRLPIAWSRLHLLPMRRTTTPLNTQNAALECLIHTPCGPIRFFSIHLAHIGVEERLEEIDFLLRLHRRVPFEGGPWSGARRRARAQLDQRRARARKPASRDLDGRFQLRTRQLGIPAYNRRQSLSSGRCLFRWFRRRGSRSPGIDRRSLHTHVKQIAGETRRRQLDHCFVGSMLASRVRRVTVDNAQTASDHHPLFDRHRSRNARPDCDRMLHEPDGLLRRDRCGRHARGLERRRQGALRPLRVDHADDARHDGRVAAGAALRRLSGG